MEEQKEVEIEYTDEELLLIDEKMKAWSPQQIKDTILSERERVTSEAQRAASEGYYKDRSEVQEDFKAEKISKQGKTALKHLEIIKGLKPGEPIPDETRKHMSRVRIKEPTQRSYEEIALEKAYNGFLNTKVTEYNHEEKTSYKTEEKIMGSNEALAAISQSLSSAVSSNFASYRHLTADKDKAWIDIVNSQQKIINFEGEKKSDIFSLLMGIINDLRTENINLHKELHEERKRNSDFFKDVIVAKTDEHQALTQLHTLKNRIENGEKQSDEIETLLMELGKFYFQSIQNQKGS